MLTINIKTVHSDYIDDYYGEDSVEIPYLAGAYAGIFAGRGYTGFDEPDELPAVDENGVGNSRILIIDEGDERSFVINEAFRSMDETTTRVDILIDPRNAFGDGRHPTTEICIHLLGCLISGIPSGERKKIRMLDAGTGSGILSVLAEKMGIPAIDAVDLSRDAVRSAATNAGLNRCEFRISCADIGNFEFSDKYGIIMANMVTDVLAANIVALANMLADNGVMIASGISAMSADRARDTFVTNGFTMMDEIAWRGWIGYKLRRSN
jgi:ribosomal protein L11 methyltransferase